MLAALSRRAAETPSSTASDTPSFFPVLIESGPGLLIGDIGRSLCLAVGLILACLLVRGYIVDRQAPTPYVGFRLRLLSLGIFAFVTCLTEYGRIGEPVTLRMPLNALALTLAVVSLIRVHQTPRPFPRHDWLEGRT